jgi:D-tagatose-1,6-bisphosphate aldolase subunit GatZ/KbaZ
MSGYLTDIVEKQKKGHVAGAVSVCSANNFVVKSAMKQALKNKLPVLIEATANQVDQNGGYTSMAPADFASYIQNIALEVGFPRDQIILGGDHLGPLTRKHLHEKDAMAYAEVLVREYVLAGYTKIHLDTSMRLGSDPDDRPLPISKIAERGARLCEISERAFEQRVANHPESLPPLYVIGSEVPIPGGTQSAREITTVTTAEHCAETFQTYQQVFKNYGLNDAFKRVIALVVQTGAEFGDKEIIEYDSEKARSLTEYGKANLPFVFEGHSTDYQTTASLRFMVQDGIAFLKVGPALTFAFREALFALEQIEREIYYGTSWTASNFKNVLELAMLDNPVHWQKHYHGNAHDRRFARKYSLSDRARYYLNDPEVMRSINCLINNINKTKIPLSLLSQYMPGELDQLVEANNKWTAEDLIMARIGLRLDTYYKAIQPTTK